MKAQQMMTRAELNAAAARAPTGPLTDYLLRQAGEIYDALDEIEQHRDAHGDLSYAWTKLAAIRSAPLPKIVQLLGLK